MAYKCFWKTYVFKGNNCANQVTRHEPIRRIGCLFIMYYYGVIFALISSRSLQDSAVVVCVCVPARGHVCASAAVVTVVHVKRV